MHTHVLPGHLLRVMGHVLSPDSQRESQRWRAGVLMKSRNPIKRLVITHTSSSSQEKGTMVLVYGNHNIIGRSLSSVGNGPHHQLSGQVKGLATKFQQQPEFSRFHLLEYFR